MIRSAFCDLTSQLCVWERRVERHLCERERPSEDYVMKASMLFPRADTALLRWSRNVVDLITPRPGDWGLDVGDVEGYTDLHDRFATSVAACDPSVRNKPAVVLKTANRAALEDGAKRVACKLYAAAGVTDAMKVQIGMRPRRSPSMIAAPTTAPVIQFITTRGNTLTLRLRADGTRRGKPAGTKGASIFSFVGAEPAGDISRWKFEANVGRVERVTLTFPDTVPAGATVWVTAFWFNARMQSGPMTSPAGVNLQGGGVVAAS
jgi:hypothetical protein